MRATMLHNMHDHATLFSSQRYTAAGCWSVLIAPQPSPPQQSFATLAGTPAQRACRSVHRAATPRSLDFDQDRSTGKLSRVSHSPPAPAGRL